MANIKSASSRKKAAQIKRRKSSVSSEHTTEVHHEMTEEQIKKARDTTRSRLQNTLTSGGRDLPTPPENGGVSTSAEQIATDIEQVIFERSKKQIDQTYRSLFSKLQISLKDNNTGMSDRLLTGRLTGAEFANLPFNELLSKERRMSDEGLRQEGLRQVVRSAADAAESIHAVQDGRDREKWGVSRSAAAIDEDDD